MARKHSEAEVLDEILELARDMQKAGKHVQARDYYKLYLDSVKADKRIDAAKDSKSAGAPAAGTKFIRAGRDDVDKLADSEELPPATTIVSGRSDGPGQVHLLKR